MKDGNMYYGRGCMNFTDPMQTDKKTGQTAWNRQQEEGTIMKVSPDRKHREIIATGIRFSVGLQFNREGDLFATDQEGATWCPGGNPVDEFCTSSPVEIMAFRQDTCTSSKASPMSPMS
jgi:glucose/arabinose dehydrogenase